MPDTTQSAPHAQSVNTAEAPQLPALIAAPQSLSAFANEQTFVAAQRMANALVSSSLVPDAYKGKENLGNALIALEMAQRIGASPLAVMQNLYIVHGRPSWSATFIIAALNSSGRFSPIRFQMSGEGEKRSCVAWALDLGNNERLEGPPVSIDTAKAEGWFSRTGSKWKTMPENMLRYRAATFFGRLYAPEVLMGMQTADEVEDAPPLKQVTPSPMLAGQRLDLPEAATETPAEQEGVKS